MRQFTKDVLTRVLTEQVGGISRDDLTAIVSDPETRDLPVLIRFDLNRMVVPAHDAAEVIATPQACGAFRDVCFTALIHKVLCERLSIERPV